MLGCYLKNCVTKIETDSGKSDRFLYAVANCQGWRVTQEDAHLALPNFQPNTSIFGVFDGHNGHEVAKFAAKYLPSFLLKNSSYNQGNIERGLQEVFMLLDEALLNKEVNDILVGYRERGNHSTSFSNKNAEKNKCQQAQKLQIAMFTGCTAVVLLIKNDIYYCANIGDSRCIISRDGRLHVLSHDHKPDNNEEKYRIEKAGGSVIQGRVNMGIDVSRAFGDHCYKRNTKISMKDQMVTAWPHTVVEQMHSKLDQFVVLMCDGVWNAMSNQDVIDFIHKRLAEMPLTKICEDVIHHILPSVMPKTGIVGKDNMTIMIIRQISSSITHHLSSPSTSSSHHECTHPIPSFIQGLAKRSEIKEKSSKRRSSLDILSSVHHRKSSEIIEKNVIFPTYSSNSIPVEFSSKLTPGKSRENIEQRSKKVKSNEHQPHHSLRRSSCGHK